jgi:hypothetical protein
VIVGTYEMSGDEPQRVKLGEVRSTATGSVELNVDPDARDFLIEFACLVDGEWLTYKDGEMWVKALPENLRGTYMWAEWTDPADRPD